MQPVAASARSPSASARKAAAPLAGALLTNRRGVPCRASQVSQNALLPRGRNCTASPSTVASAALDSRNSIAPHCRARIAAAGKARLRLL
jgi:hypothetical protein